MATGGYKCVRFQWQGGRTDSAIDRTKFVLNGICDAILSANMGWEYDSLTPSQSDFLTMPTNNASNYPNFVKVLKLEDNGSTYKLGVGYYYKNNYNSNTPMKPTDCVYTGNAPYTQGGFLGGGLYLGFIKDGTLVSDSTYGWVWDGNGDFLRWMPTCTAAVNDVSSFASQNTNTYTYTFYVLLKKAQLAFFSRSSSWTAYGKIRGILVGELFKETGHTEDTKTIGACYLTRSEAQEISAPGSGLIASNNAYNLEYSNSGYTTGNQIISASGEVYPGCPYLGNYGYLYNCMLYLDTRVASSNVSEILNAPGGRWTPCYMYLQAADHDAYYVVPGDGFKGFIDTDLLRGVNPNYSYGQQLDGGKFIYIGGGFAIGWDPSNTVPLF